ncbi:sensor histidine kinase [Nonomuraea sp. NPDC050783]|uniref:sensor histidine kinase n=1 Tax=Nonomuraea sp. NPDC050783 TaxID=3154634 RepID=UPI003465B31E
MGRAFTARRRPGGPWDGGVGRRPRDGHGPERRLLVRARRRLTVQVAAAVSAVLAAVGVLVLCFMTHGQDEAARRDLAAAARHSPVAYPPPCVWLFERAAGWELASPGAPAGLPVRAELDRVAAGGEPRVTRAEAAGREYLVRTERRGGQVVQAVMDLYYPAAERARLLRTLALAEGAGLLAALLIGQVVSRRAIAPLGEALARQRRFAADLSHELRTPLTRLNTRAQLLARKIRGGGDPILLLDEVDQLVTGSGQLGEVVEDLLRSARFQQLDRPFAPVDLAALAAEQVVAEGARAQAAGVVIELRRDDGDRHHVVRGVRSALRRVIAALLDNALGHTAPGGHIWVTLAARGGAVELTVRDDGAGLDPADAERLFTPFVGGGFGLGLALVREVVAGHGGTVTADGRPGGGAAFTLRLPAVLPAVDAAPEPARPEKEPA